MMANHSTIVAAPQMSALDGFTPYIRMTEHFGGPPPRDALVRFFNEYTGQMWTGRDRDLHPEFNVASLWWKWTAIGRMEYRDPTGPTRHAT